MEDRDDTIYLNHIFEAITKIEEYTQGVEEKDFKSNKILPRQAAEYFITRGIGCALIPAASYGVFTRRYKLLQDGVIREIEIIGEGLKRI